MEKLPVYGISEFVNKTEEKAFYANFLPIHLHDHQFVNEHHRHSTFVAVLFTQGTGEHLIDFHTYEVKRGSFFLLHPGQVHCWTLSKDVDGFVFFHTKEFYEQSFLNHTTNDFPIFNQEISGPLFQLDEQTIMTISPLFDSLTTECQNNKPFKNLKIISTIQQIYIETSRLVDSSKSTTNNPNHYFKLNKFQHLVEENFLSEKQPSFYAEKLNITTRHLSRICNEALNKTPSEIIQDRVLLETKRQLIHQDKSIAQIAEEMGFEEASYFIRFFKKKAGITPKEFQKSVKRLP